EELETARTNAGARGGRGSIHSSRGTKRRARFSSDLDAAIPHTVPPLCIFSDAGASITLLFLLFSGSGGQAETPVDSCIIRMHKESLVAVVYRFDPGPLSYPQTTPKRR
ncbi:unnamed protein product, partial [Laminaria digitata]